MPIGWVNDGGPGRSRTPFAADPGWSNLPKDEPVTEDTPRAPGPSLARQQEARLWMRWHTAGDERVCPVCAPLHGRLWIAGQGPMPPLHGNCRCERALAFVEWVTVE